MPRCYFGKDIQLTLKPGADTPTASRDTSYLQGYLPASPDSMGTPLYNPAEELTSLDGGIPIFRIRTPEETQAAHDLLHLSQSLPAPPVPSQSLKVHLTIEVAQEQGAIIGLSNAQSYQLAIQELPPTPPSDHSDLENTSPLFPQDETKPISPILKDAPINMVLGETLKTRSESPTKTPQTIQILQESDNNHVKTEEQTPFNCSNNQLILLDDAKDSSLCNAIVSDGRKRLGGSGNRGKFSCNKCGKQYATSSNLSRHKQTHRSLDSGAARQCPTCGKTYVSMPALSMHLLTHRCAHRCGVCGKSFSRPWLLQGHMRSHTGERPYLCIHCGKAFADRSNLRAHIQTHASAKSFRCHRCHKAFALKSYLHKHQESACGKTNNEQDESS